MFRWEPSEAGTAISQHRVPLVRQEEMGGGKEGVPRRKYNVVERAVRASPEASPSSSLCSCRQTDKEAPFICLPFFLFFREIAVDTAGAVKKTE